MSFHHDVERFGDWAPSYEQHWMQRWLFTPVQRVVLEVAAAQIASPAAILDVGCGTGRLLRSARMRFPQARLAGVDAAEGMIAQARQAVTGVNSAIDFQVATAESLPFAGATFDLVFSTLTFHHWADQRRGIAEVKRVLRDNGRWIVADFIASGLAAAISRGRMPERRRFDAMLAEAGLHVVDKRSVWRTMGQISVLSIAPGD